MRLIHSAMTLIVGATFVLSASCKTPRPPATSNVQEDGTNAVVEEVIKTRFKAAEDGGDLNYFPRRGTLDNRPAFIVEALSDSGDWRPSLVVRLNKTLDWTSAKEQCESFAPAGRWSLPDEQGFFNILQSTDLGFEVPFVSGSSAHVMFVRTNTNDLFVEAKTSKMSTGAFANTSKAAFLIDGQGPVSIFDIRTVINEGNNDLARDTDRSAEVDAKRSFRTFLNTMKDGIPAVCVLK